MATRLMGNEEGKGKGKGSKGNDDGNEGGGGGRGQGRQGNKDGWWADGNVDKKCNGNKDEGGRQERGDWQGR